MDAQDREVLRGIQADVKDLVKQGAVHNVLLQTHEARSLALQTEQKLQAERMEPLQRHVDIVNGTGKVALAILSALAIAALTKLIL